jgi:hypothetical protein
MLEPRYDRALDVASSRRRLACPNGVLENRIIIGGVVAPGV